MFVLTEDRRKWLIPSAAIEGRYAISLGGPKYSEFEVDSAPGSNGRSPSTIDSDRRGSVGVGEPSAAVNRVPRAEGVRIPPPPSPSGAAGSDPVRAPTPPSFPTRFERTRISVAHQVTIPSVPFRAAELQVGDKLRSWADGRGRVVFERIEEPCSPLPFAEPNGSVGSPSGSVQS